jgi:hypothetical protein
VFKVLAELLILGPELPLNAIRLQKSFRCDLHPRQSKDRALTSHGNREMSTDLVSRDEADGVEVCGRGAMALWRSLSARFKVQL